MPLSSPRIVNSSNDDFSYFPPILMSSSPVGHLRSNPVSQEQKYPFQLNSTPAFHQQNGRSMDETVGYLNLRNAPVTNRIHIP